MAQVSLVGCRCGFFPFLEKYSVVVFGDSSDDGWEDPIVDRFHGGQQFDSFRERRVREIEIELPRGEEVLGCSCVAGSSEEGFQGLRGERGAFCLAIMSSIAFYYFMEYGLWVIK